MDANKILILGVGNILTGDDGVGVHVLERLERGYAFSDNVELCEGGTLGLRLLGPICGSEHVVIVDSVLNGGKPGTIYRLTGEDIPKSIRSKSSVHQLDLLETLAFADLMGRSPTLVVVGIEPRDLSSWNIGLSPDVTARLDDILVMVLSEVESAGGTFTPLDRPSASEA